jgi:hypothetical protein
VLARLVSPSTVLQDSFFLHNRILFLLSLWMMQNSSVVMMQTQPVLHFLFILCALFFIPLRRWQLITLETFAVWGT